MKYGKTLAGAVAGLAMFLGSTVASLASLTPIGSGTYPGVTLTAPGLLFGDNGAGTTLNDTWFFNFTAPTYLTTADASNSTGAYTNFQLSLFQYGTNALVAAGSIVSGPAEDSHLGPIVLAPGSYYLNLVGTGITNAGFLYPEVISGNLNVQAVPLPGAAPLFATGLGMLGLLAARRKKAKVRA